MQKKNLNIQESHMVSRRKALLSLHSVLDFQQKFKSVPPKTPWDFIYTLEALFRKENGVLNRRKQNSKLLLSLLLRNIYRLPTKLRESNVFTGGCLSVYTGESHDA